MVCVVTGSFQFRGGMWRTGQRIEVARDELADPFVAEHVRPAEGGEAAAPRPAPVLSNGTERKRSEGNRPRRTGLEFA